MPVEYVEPVKITELNSSFVPLNWFVDLCRPPVDLRRPLFDINDRIDDFQSTSREKVNQIVTDAPLNQLNHILTPMSSIKSSKKQ